MGRNQNRKGAKRERNNGEWTADARDEGTITSPALEKYYRGKIIRSEEWEAFLLCMQSSLPLALRVNISLPHAEEVAELVHRELSAVFRTKVLPFFPRQLAMQSDASRGDLKRNSEHKRIKKIIAALNEGGYLTRQETVSMIPPLLLNAQPGMTVLDLCSAPGSKTSQILEVIVQGDKNRGVVVANDLNSSRLDVLTHQTNRCPEAHSHLIITNHDAMNWPLMSAAEDKFDRVLCDVMCSGDGTLRKSMDLWGRWNTVQGADLHMSQCRVLTRGMQLCKKGGVVVYSTCSMNPVEDEAVISECLTRSQGTFRLIDPTPFLPGLIGERGVASWTLTTKDLDAELSTIEEANAYREKHEGKGFNYRPSMFANAEKLSTQNIQYAIRVLPHQQDTGGFFIAALEALDDYPKSIVAPPETVAEKPLRYVGDSVAATIQATLGLPATFPYKNLYFRNEGAREQKIYYVADDVARVLPTIGANVAQVGAKVFESYAKHRNDKLRFCAEGLATLAHLLPSEFFVDVDPQLILDFASNNMMDASVFCRKANVADINTLPVHSFVLKARLPFGLDCVQVAAEKMTGNAITAKVLDWQIVLCKLGLGLPVVTLDDKKDREEDEVEEGE